MVIALGITTSAQAAPIQEIRVVSLSAHDHHNCAIDKFGKVFCWGTSQSGAINVPVGLEKMSQVAIAGDSYEDHTCVLSISGNVRCWGSNDEGQINVPSNLGRVSQISAGGKQTCAIAENGKLFCWGRNSSGQTKVPTDLGKVMQVSAAQWDTCAITLNQNLRCWGSNASGQIDIPRDLGKVRQVDAGSEHTCALTVDYSIRCWGQWWSFGPANLNTGPHTFKKVSSGPWSTCGLGVTGLVRCWGYNSDVLNIGFAKAGQMRDVSAGLLHACGVNVTGKVLCFGDNSEKQLDTPSSLGEVLSQSPKAPNNLSVKTLNSNSVLLGWDRVESIPKVESYQLDVQNNLGDWSPIQLRSPLSTTASVRGLAPGALYKFRLCAVNSDGPSEYSIIQVAIPPAVPSAPTNLQAINVTSNSSTIFFDPPQFNGGAPISNYVLETRLGSLWMEIPAQQVGSFQLNVAGLNPSTRYVFRIKTLNVAGASKPSSMIFVTTGR